MNLALVLALFAATVSITTALAHFAIARAPGWGAARSFAWIALSAGVYSLANLVPPTQGLPLWVYGTSTRFNYASAHFHMLAWFPFVFGSVGHTTRPLPRVAWWFMCVSAAVGLFFLATDLHLTGGVHVLTIDWAHVTYTYGTATPIGEWYTLVTGATLIIPFTGLVWRMLHGEGELWPIVAGFVVFAACAVIETLVAVRVMDFISPADVGFLAVVIPTAWLLARRFLADARRLDRLSQDLAGQVAARTEERDRAESALVESERLAALGRLAAGVGHEVNNPLTYMRFALERVDDHLQATAAPADVREALADATDGANRIRKVVEGLQTYSRRHAERVPLDLREVARAALKVARPQLRHVALIETELGEAPRVLGDESSLVQALVNLLANAAQALGASRSDGRIVVRTYGRGGEHAVLEVEDNGPGMPDEVRGRVLEPYFTTRAAQGGLGLGLFVTRGIVDAHEGRIELSGDGRGTCARLVLPAVEERAEAAQGDAPERAADATDASVVSPPHDAPRRSILLVDDEPLVLQMLAGVLAIEWDVTCAANGYDALAQLEHGAFDAVVCDLMMPGISGIELARVIAERSPDLRRRMVFLTGGAVTPEAGEFLDRPDVVHLMKPVELEILADAIRTACALAPVDTAR